MTTLRCCYSLINGGWHKLRDESLPGLLICCSSLLCAVNNPVTYNTFYFYLRVNRLLLQNATKHSVVAFEAARSMSRFITFCFSKSISMSGHSSKSITVFKSFAFNGLLSISIFSIQLWNAFAIVIIAPSVLSSVIHNRNASIICSCYFLVSCPSSLHSTSLLIAFCSLFFSLS